MIRSRDEAFVGWVKPTKPMGFPEIGGLHPPTPVNMKTCLL
jgi:hypothetical protein